MRLPFFRTTQKHDLLTKRSLRTTRRTLVAASAVAVALPMHRVPGQESPPIEPRDDDDPGNDIIEPEVQPTIPPDDSAAEVIEATGTGTGRYFAETGHNLDEPFLSAWEKAGGESGPGLPLSESRYAESDAGIRQDFAGMALLFNPDAGENGSIGGVKLASEAFSGLGTTSQAGTVTATGAIATFWQAHGAEQLLGAAVTAPKTSGGVTTQGFANAILEQDAAGKVTMKAANQPLVTNLLASDAAFQPAPPTGGTSFLVSASDGLFLRAGASDGAEVVALLPDNAEFIAAGDPTSTWVPGYVDGFAGWVSGAFLVERSALPDTSSSQWRLDVWSGAALGETNVRKEPSTTSQSMRTIPAGDPLVVTGWVKGESVSDNQITWAELEDGGFVYARNIGRAAPVEPPALPNDAPSEGRWIDVHLTQQLMVAYEGRTPVRTIVTTTGMPGWETPPGFYHINTRVANETMESGSIGAENFYVLKDVLFTQYFTDRGHALHFAWWKSVETIGRPGSHGCLNLLLEDAQFFWDWADIGTAVLVRTV